jgi:DNA-directed RNA polymerase subunit M/transcription elongation factor TFIIS
MLYTILTIKVLENLKNSYVLTSIKNGTWNPESLAMFDKDVLNPEKWQHIQDARLPKNVKTKKKKGVYRCKRCGGWETEYTSCQTRSADESSTLFFFCTDCNHRWKM